MNNQQARAQLRQLQKAVESSRMASFGFCASCGRPRQKSRIEVVGSDGVPAKRWDTCPDCPPPDEIRRITLEGVVPEFPPPKKAL